MTGYRLEVTCPRCGGPLDHVTTSKPFRADRGEWNASISAIARCPEDRHGTWQVRVSMAPAGDERAIEYKRKARR